MVKYFKELENKKEFYLPLIEFDRYGEKIVPDAKISHTFIEEYSDVFNKGDSLIRIFENFDIDKWDSDNVCLTYEQYEEKNDIWFGFDTLRNDMDLSKSNFSKLNLTASEIKGYLLTIKDIAFLFQSLLPHHKELYSAMYERIKTALKVLENYAVIKYEKEDKGKYLYQPDAWYITPNNYLYNVDDHSGRNLFIKYRLERDSLVEHTDNKLSDFYFDMAKEIEEKNYVTRGLFQHFLNYCSKPMYLEEIDSIPITRERNVIKLILGIINAHACFYKTFEELCLKTDNPKEELEKIERITNHCTRDILVRYCGFHKVESTVDKTITTSLVNYEEEFKEYIDRGWTISFVPPIIMDDYDHTIKEYPEEFLKIRKVLKRK